MATASPEVGVFTAHDLAAPQLFSHPESILNGVSALYFADDGTGISQTPVALTIFDPEAPSSRQSSAPFSAPPTRHAPTFLDASQPSRLDPSEETFSADLIFLPSSEVRAPHALLSACQTRPSRLDVKSPFAPSSTAATPHSALVAEHSTSTIPPMSRLVGGELRRLPLISAPPLPGYVAQASVALASSSDGTVSLTASSGAENAPCRSALPSLAPSHAWLAEGWWRDPPTSRLTLLSVHPQPATFSLAASGPVGTAPHGRSALAVATSTHAAVLCWPAGAAAGATAAQAGAEGRGVRPVCNLRLMLMRQAQGGYVAALRRAVRARAGLHAAARAALQQDSAPAAAVAPGAGGHAAALGAKPRLDSGAWWSGSSSATLAALDAANSAFIAHAPALAAAAAEVTAVSFSPPFFVVPHPTSANDIAPAAGPAPPAVRVRVCVMAVGTRLGAVALFLIPAHFASAPPPPAAPASAARPLPLPSRAATAWGAGLDSPWSLAPAHALARALIAQALPSEGQREQQQRGDGRWALTVPAHSHLAPFPVCLGWVFPDHLSSPVAQSEATTPAGVVSSPLVHVHASVLVEAEQAQHSLGALSRPPVASLGFAGDATGAVGARGSSGAPAEVVMSVVLGSGHGYHLSLSIPTVSPPSTSTTAAPGYGSGCVASWNEAAAAAASAAGGSAPVWPAVSAHFIGHRAHMAHGLGPVQAWARSSIPVACVSSSRGGSWDGALARAPAAAHVHVASTAAEVHVSVIIPQPPLEPQTSPALPCVLRAPALPVAAKEGSLAPLSVDFLPHVQAREGLALALEADAAADAASAAFTPSTALSVASSWWGESTKNGSAGISLSSAAVVKLLPPHPIGVVVCSFTDASVLFASLWAFPPPALVSLPQRSTTGNTSLLLPTLVWGQSVRVRRDRRDTLPLPLPAILAPAQAADIARAALRGVGVTALDLTVTLPGADPVAVPATAVATEGVSVTVDGSALAETVASAAAYAAASTLGRDAVDDDTEPSLHLSAPPFHLHLAFPSDGLSFCSLFALPFTPGQGPFPGAGSLRPDPSSTSTSSHSAAMGGNGPLGHSRAARARFSDLIGLPAAIASDAVTSLAAAGAGGLEQELSPLAALRAALRVEGPWADPRLLPLSTRATGLAASAAAVHDSLPAVVSPARGAAANSPWLKWYAGLHQARAGIGADGSSGDDNREDGDDPVARDLIDFVQVTVATPHDAANEPVRRLIAAPSLNTLLEEGASGAIVGSVRVAVTMEPIIGTALSAWLGSACSATDSDEPNGYITPRHSSTLPPPACLSPDLQLLFSGWRSLIDGLARSALAAARSAPRSADFMAILPSADHSAPIPIAPPAPRLSWARVRGSLAWIFHAHAASYAAFLVRATSSGIPVLPCPSPGASADEAAWAAVLPSLLCRIRLTDPSPVAAATALARASVVCHQTSVGLSDDTRVETEDRAFFALPLDPAIVRLAFPQPSVAMDDTNTECTTEDVKEERDAAVRAIAALPTAEASSIVLPVGAAIAATFALACTFAAPLVGFSALLSTAPTATSASAARPVLALTRMVSRAGLELTGAALASSVAAQTSRVARWLLLRTVQNTSYCSNENVSDSDGKTGALSGYSDSEWSDADDVVSHNRNLATSANKIAKLRRHGNRRALKRVISGTSVAAAVAAAATEEATARRLRLVRAGAAATLTEIDRIRMIERIGAAAEGDGASGDPEDGRDSDADVEEQKTQDGLFARAIQTYMESLSSTKESSNAAEDRRFCLDRSSQGFTPSQPSSSAPYLPQGSLVLLPPLPPSVCTPAVAAAALRIGAAAWIPGLTAGSTAFGAFSKSSEFGSGSAFPPPLLSLLQATFIAFDDAATTTAASAAASAAVTSLSTTISSGNSASVGRMGAISALVSADALGASLVATARDITAPVDQAPVTNAGCGPAPVWLPRPAAPLPFAASEAQNEEGVLRGPWRALVSASSSDLGDASTVFVAHCELDSPPTLLAMSLLPAELAARSKGWSAALAASLCDESQDSCCGDAVNAVYSAWGRAAAQGQLSFGPVAADPFDLLFAPVPLTANSQAVLPLAPLLRPANEVVSRVRTLCDAAQCPSLLAAARERAQASQDLGNAAKNEAPDAISRSEPPRPFFLIRDPSFTAERAAFSLAASILRAPCALRPSSLPLRLPPTLWAREWQLQARLVSCAAQSSYPITETCTSSHTHEWVVEALAPSGQWGRGLGFAALQLTAPSSTLSGAAPLPILAAVSPAAVTSASAAVVSQRVGLGPFPRCAAAALAPPQWAGTGASVAPHALAGAAAWADPSLWDVQARAAARSGAHPAVGECSCCGQPLWGVALSARAGAAPAALAGSRVDGSFALRSTDEQEKQEVGKSIVYDTNATWGRDAMGESLGTRNDCAWCGAAVR